MHITILALGSRGDIQPYATLGQRLHTLGHSVCFITTENFRTLVVAHELDFYAIPGDAQALVQAAGADMVKLLRAFGSLANGPVPDVPPPIRETDLIINQLPLGLTGYDLAEKFNLPMLLAAVIPLFPTKAFPVMGLPALPVPGYNRFTYVFAQQLGWQLFRPNISRWRRKLELPPAPRFGYFKQLGTARFPVLNGFSPHVVPRPTDWNEHVHVTGYWFPEDEDWQPPDSLRAFIEAGPPPVFIGFGSMPVRDPQRATAMIVDALEPSGQRAILHAGWGNLGQTSLPKHIFPIDYAPYNWLFPRMSLVIHHGGSGTTAFGLRAGVPSLIVPFVFDQFYWGKRIATLGVGPRPIAFRRLTAQRLAGAITTAIEDRSMRQRAAELGRQIQAEDGLATAVQVIEQTDGQH
jgi:UDP:flavonoid glycosyltransferase YjiC (YdhE family)